MYQQQAQPNLTGAYYGPPIPASHPPPKRRRCNPCCCILSTIVTLVVLFGIFVLVVWLVLRPKVIQVAVEDVKLNAFNLSSDSNLLTYNLVANISITNPNTKIGVYYDYLETDLYYGGWRLAVTPLRTFYQGTRDTQYLSQSVVGSSAVGSGVGSRFSSDRSSGFYDIEMWIYGNTRLRVGGTAGSPGKLRAWCQLRVPASSSTSGFQRTRCFVRKFG